MGLGVILLKYASSNYANIHEVGFPNFTSLLTTNFIRIKGVPVKYTCWRSKVYTGIQRRWKFLTTVTGYTALAQLVREFRVPQPVNVL